MFWVAVIVFGLASWVVIKYAQGYVYDWSTHAFVRTGAIAATVNTSATMLLNGREVSTTSFIGNRAGADGLAPGAYTVKVTRDGYSTWQKTATVQEGVLTDFPSVMILPTDDASQIDLKAEASRSLAEAHTLPRRALQLTVNGFTLKGTQLLDSRTASASFVAENVLGLTPTGDGSRILWWTHNELWVLWLNNTNSQPYRTEDERMAITRFSVPIVRAAWFRDDDHIVVDLGNRTYRIIETDTRGGTNIIKM